MQSLDDTILIAGIREIRTIDLNWGDYLINPKYFDRQASASSIDLDQMLQSAASDPGLHCLPCIKQFLDSSTGHHMDLFKI